jgi:hypothetical protein
MNRSEYFRKWYLKNRPAILAKRRASYAANRAAISRIRAIKYAAKVLAREA